MYAMVKYIELHMKLSEKISGHERHEHIPHMESDGAEKVSNTA